MKNRLKVSLLLIISELAILYLMLRITGMDTRIHYTRYAFMYLMLGTIYGNYSIRTNMIWDEFKKTILSHLCFFLATQAMNPFRRWDLHFMIVNLIISLVMMIASIVLNRSYRILFRNSLLQKVVIFGTGDNAEKLEERFRTNRFPVSEVIAIVNINNSPKFPEFEQKMCEFHAPMISIDDIDEFFANNVVDEAILAIPDSDKAIETVIYNLIKDKVTVIKSIPKVNGLVSYGAKIEDFDGVFLISSSAGLITNDKLGLFVKRVIDILAGLVGLILLIPLTIYVKIGNLRCGDHGPIFFVQPRLGKNGKTFKLIKYRSMVMNAEEKLQELFEKDESMRIEYETNKKLDNDPRITSFGQKIRRTSIDEMPQLINVLLGDMSLVGPRPYLLTEKEDMGDAYNAVIACKPGLTGMWQTHGRSDTTWDDRLWFDEYYYRNWTIWLDLTILTKTVRVVFDHEGAK